jgi:hypothetical protein
MRDVLSVSPCGHTTEEGSVMPDHLLDRRHEREGDCLEEAGLLTRDHFYWPPAEQPLYVIRSLPHGIEREGQFLGEAGPARISIGWPTKVSLAGKGVKEIAMLLDAEGEPASALTVTQIHNFVNIPVGALILTPSVRDKALLHVFRTVSCYEYVSEWAPEGNPHTIRVDHVATVPRAACPRAIQKALLASRKAVTRIHTVKSDVVLQCLRDLQDRVPRTAPQETARTRATNELIALLDSQNEDIRLRAAVAILENAL